MNFYFPLIDLLRFLAAFAVLCFHYFSSSLIGKSGVFPLFSSYGMLGVQLFFIISGFVIFFSLNKPIKEYALGRFLRLYPLFWIACTVTYVATLLIPHGEPLPFYLYLYNLLIINTGKTSLMIDGSYWTLTIEILFYFFIGLFTFIFGIKRILFFYLGWLAVTFGAFYFGYYHLLILKILLIRQAPYFIFGGLTAYLYSTYKHAKKWEVLAALLALPLSLLMPFYINTILSSDKLPRTNSFGIYDSKAQVIVVILFFVFLLAVYASKYVYNEKIISLTKKLGLITYPLYLLHQKIGSLILGSSFGKITTLSLLTGAGMIIASYLLATKEAALRKIFYKKITIALDGFLKRDKKT